MTYEQDLQTWSDLPVSSRTADQQAALNAAIAAGWKPAGSTPSTATTQQDAAAAAAKQQLAQTNPNALAAANAAGPNYTPDQAAIDIAQIEADKAAALANLNAARDYYYNIANSGQYSWRDETYINAQQAYNVAYANYDQVMKDSIVRYNNISGAVPTSSGGGVGAGDVLGVSKTFGTTATPYQGGDAGYGGVNIPGVTPTPVQAPSSAQPGATFTPSALGGYLETAIPKTSVVIPEGSIMDEYGNFLTPSGEVISPLLGTTMSQSDYVKSLGLDIAGNVGYGMNQLLIANPNGMTVTPYMQPFLSENLSAPQILNAAYGLELSQKLASDFFGSQEAAQRAQSGQKAQPQDFVGAIVGIPDALYGGAQAIQEGITGFGNSAYDAIAASGLPRPISGFANIEVGFATAVASTVPFVLSVPYAAKWTVTNPLGVPGKAFEIGSQMVGDIWEREQKSPGSATGTAFGMYAGGKLLGYGYEQASARAPVSVNIATPIPNVDGGFNYVTTVFTKNPLSIDAPTARGYAMFGSEVEGLKVGFGSPVPAAIEARISVLSPELFNVRNQAATATKAQINFIDPFMREVSKGTPEGHLVNAVFDIKEAIPRSEGVITYENAQPAGTFKQTGVDAAVQAEVHEILANAGATRLGSAATTDFLGQKFMRDTLKSDIDVDIPDSAYDAAIAEVAKAYSKNPREIIQEGGKFAFADDIAAGKTFKEAHIFAAGKESTYPDVRSMKVETETGAKIGQQTPEYGIESKASRLMGKGAQISYSPDTGVVAKVSALGKPATDIADIYLGSRGIAKAAYKQGYYDLGGKYETISDNLKAYANEKGYGEVLQTVKEDTLKGVPRAPVRPGSILGVGIDIGRLRPKEEYPSGVQTPSSKAGVAVAAIIVGQPEYPVGADQYPQVKAELVSMQAYPTVVSQSAAQYPGGSAVGGSGTPHPVGMIPQIGEYPAALPGSVDYPTSTKPIEYPGAVVNPPPGYPIGGVESPYPTGVEYPTVIQPAIYTKTPSAFVAVQQGFPVTTSPKIPIPERFFPFPKQELPKGKTKFRQQKGKRFVEIFSFDVFKGMKVPERAYVKNYRTVPKRFTETFSLDMVNPVTGMQLPTKSHTGSLKRTKTQKMSRRKRK